MNRSLVSLTLVVQCCLLSLSQAEIEFVYAIKEKAYDQVGNTPPTTVREWNFGAGVSGDNQVTGATVTHPGSGTPIVLSGEPGDYELDDENYLTKDAMDTAYPNGNVTVTVTHNGADQVVGPLSVTGDAYPIIPNITNAVELSAADHTQDFTVTWNSFIGSSEGDQIIFQLWENDLFTENEIAFEFLDRSVTSFLIPGGTLSSNKSYELDLVFIKETDSGPAAPDTIVGYLTTTNFEFSTFTQSGEGEEVLISRGILAFQSEQNLPTSGQYSFLAEVDGASISSATLVKPDSSEVNIPADGVGQFDLEETYVSEGERDTAYPEGDYSVRLVSNSGTNTYGPYALSGGTTPVIPGILNYSQAQSIDPDNDFRLDWNVFSNAGDEAYVVLELWNNNNFQNEVEWNLASDSQGILIPSDFLQPNSSYTGALVFANPVIGPIDDQGVTIETLYESITTFNFRTDGGNGGGPNVSGLFLLALKVQNYNQENSFEPVFEKWEAFTQVSDDDTAITGFTLLAPDGPIVIVEDEGDFEDELFYDSQAAMDSENPDGNYTFQITQNGATNDFGPYGLTGSAYPEVPYITNWAALQGYDTSQDITIEFTPFTSANGNDIIAFSIETDDQLGGEDPIFEFLDPGVSSYLIPGGTLQPNRNYRGQIIFGNITGYNETNPFVLVGYSVEVEYPISTYPQYNVSNELDIWISKGSGAIQTSDQNPGQQSWYFFAEGGVSGITSMSINTPGGSEVNLAPTPDEFGYLQLEAMFDSQTELDTTYPDGDYNATITVNGVASDYGPFNLTGGSPPNQPYFTNFNDFQQVDPSQPFTIEWAPYNNPPQNARLSLEIDGAPGYSDLEVSFDSQDPSLTSVEIPANTLEPNSKYIVTGYFEQPSELGTDPEVFAGYEAYVQATIWTTDPSIGPSPASNLTAQIENQFSVQLNWEDTSENETGFRIERKAIWEDQYQWSPLEVLTANSTTFVDSSVGIGEAYNYRVVVFDDSGDGARSSEVEVRMQSPQNPTRLQVNPYNSNTLTVSWDDNSQGESGFEIDRSTDGSNWSNAGNTGSNENVFIDSGLDSDTTYIYRVRAISGLGASDTSEEGSDSTYQATTGKPVNISTRGTIGTGEDFIMIAGFIISGNETKDILIRGVAPSLTGVNAPLLQDPELVLFDGNVEIDQNNDWQDHPQAADITATGIPPQDPKESAIFTTLQPGVPYTVWMRGADGGEGAGLVEVYEANAANDAKLINISTRGITAAGDGVMIAGVIVQGTGNRTLYITGKGPSLPSNLPGRLVDPKLTLINTTDPVNPIQIDFNDNWQDNANFAGIVATTIPPVFPEEAALLVNVPPGSYTIKLEGTDAGEGLAIIEVFEVPDTL